MTTVSILLWMMRWEILIMVKYVFTQTWKANFLGKPFTQMTQKYIHTEKDSKAQADENGW